MNRLFSKQTITLYPTPIFVISLILYALLAVFVQPSLGEMFLLYDNGDLFLHNPDGYFIESKWVDNNVVAYKDYIVEYPPMGLYSYSLPRIFFNIYNQQQFLYAFVFIALFPLFFTFYLLLKRQPRLVLFLCTPTFYCYSLCRFDIFPALASLIAILLIIEKKNYWGAIVLGLAIGLKWYPVVLVLPLLAMQEEKLKWLMIIGIATLFFCFHHVFYVGFENALATYTFHTGRGTNEESLLYLIIHYRWNDNLPDLLRHTFFVLQFLPSFMLSLFLYQQRVKMSQEIISVVSIITILSFILFAKFHSPQWLIWVIPFIILLGDKKIIWVYVVLDIINYIAIAIISYIYQYDSGIFDIFNLARVILTMLLIYMSLEKLKQLIKPIA